MIKTKRNASFAMFPPAAAFVIQSLAEHALEDHT